MSTVSLQFPDPGMKPLRLVASHALGWHAGRLQPVTETGAAVLWFHYSTRGLWLTRTANAPAVHLNGRQVQRMAWLRCGDVVHVGQTELRLLGAAPTAADKTMSASTTPRIVNADQRIVLRGIGGAYHGRSFTLERPLLAGRSSEADIRIDDPVFAGQHARLEWINGQLIVHDLGSSEGSLVNGHPVRNAVLAAGDQIVFATHERFVLETSLPPRYTQPPDTTAAAVDATPVAPLPPAPAHWPHLVWLLLAAVLLASGLVLLLLFAPV